MNKNAQDLPEAKNQLRDLDRGLLRLRRLWLQQGRRRRLIDDIGQPIAMSVLRTLFAIHTLNSNTTSVSDVATELEVDASTASRLVESAVANGFALRSPSATDRRKSVLNLTEAGERILHKAQAAREAILEDVTKHWTHQEIELIATLLNRLHDDFERIDQTQDR